MFAITRNNQPVSDRSYRRLSETEADANALAKADPDSMYRVVDVKLGVVMTTWNRKPVAVPEPFTTSLF